MEEGGVGKGPCKRFEFYFHETPLAGSVRIQKCLNYLNSSDHLTELVRFGSDQQII